MLLMPAWARSGRVSAVIDRLLASPRAFCHSACWVVRSLSSISRRATLSPL